MSGLAVAGASRLAWWPRVALALTAAMLASSASAAKNKAPSVAITAPAAGTSFSVPATIAIVATASDSDGSVTRVDFYQGSTLIGTRTAAPYTLTWSAVATGSYTLTAKATDNAGASTTSAAIPVTVTAPKIAIAQPANGAMVYGNQAAVAGTFSGETGSTIIVDGPFGSRLATISGSSFSASVPIVPGANTLRATIARRNRTFDTASVGVIGNLDPLITFVSPAATAFDTSSTVSLEVDALSPSASIARVDFYRGAAPLGFATTPPYRFAWANPPFGNYDVSAVATDDMGHTGTATLPIVVSGPNLSPTVAIASPMGGATFTAPATIAIVASANDPDGVVVRVEFLSDGVVIGMTNVPPYAMSWNGAAAGTYALAARATDDRAAVMTSAPVTVIVQPPNVPPSVALVQPADGARFTAPASIALVATASDPDGAVARVDFLQGTTTIGSATTAPFAATWSNAAPGTYAVTARATDNVGATAVSAPATIVVAANVPPIVSLSAPSSGATFVAPAEITLAAQASDPDGTVASVGFYQGTTLIGSATSAPFSVKWTGAAAGSYALTARATDNAGAVGTSAPVTISVTAPVLTIESPLSGATIAADHVHVQGAVDAPAGAGLVVNGVIAAVEGGRFYAANVPLSAGVNALTATLTRIDGATTTRSISVTSLPAPVSISVGPAQGFAPLTVTVAVTSQGGAAVAKVEIDPDGNGAIDGTILAAPWETTVQYLSSATVNLVVRVTDTAGGVYTETVPIVITDKAALDQRVRAVWTGMTAALTASDIAGALTFLDPLARQRYAPVFSLLQPEFATIVGTFSSLQGVSLTQDFGEYAVNRVIDGQNRIYFIYFGLNGDGVWRLGSM